MERQKKRVRPTEKDLKRGVSLRKIEILLEGLALKREMAAMS